MASKLGRPEAHDLDALDGDGRSFFAIGARCVFAALLIVPLLLIWWTGQGCIDDPCSISLQDELTGLAALIGFGSLFLRIASPRIWVMRAIIWMLTGIPAFVAFRNLEPTGGGIVRDVPSLTATGTTLLWTYLVAVIVTLVLDLLAARDRN